MQAWEDCGPGGPGLGPPPRAAGPRRPRPLQAALGRGLGLGRVDAGPEAPGPPLSARSPDGRPGAQEALEGLVGRRPRRLCPGTQHHGRRRRCRPPPAAAPRPQQRNEEPSARGSRGGGTRRSDPASAGGRGREEEERRTGSCCRRTAIVDGRARPASFSLSNRGLVRC